MELMRQVGVTYKTAWRMNHQIRQLMTSENTERLEGIIEADETYIGNKKAPRLGKRAGHGHKHTVFALVERGGQVHSTYIPTERKGGTAAKIAKAIAETAEVRPGVMFDYDAKGRIVAFEILDASRNLAATDMKKLALEVA